MADIIYSGINQKISNCSTGQTILDASITHKIPHVRECGGNGKCTTCRVRVVNGMENLSPKTNLERKIAHDRRWDPTIRLGCQAEIQGDIEIQRLIWSNSDVNQLQKETVPNGEAVERNIAILFCDIRNYTQLSSHTDNFDIAFLLNKFYTELGEPILMNNGIIYQYVGDEIIGVFGTHGGSKSENCENAIRAALGMKYALTRLNKMELNAFDVNLNIGIGIHYGKAFVGHLGHPSHRQFSVIGDPVNVASRIQGMTKLHEAKILISDAMMNHVNPETIALSNGFKVSLKGKDLPMTLFELKGFTKADFILELQSSLHTLLKDQDAFAKLFYDKVFAAAPFLRPMFGQNMANQGRMLTHMLGGIVYALTRSDNLSLGLRKLGKNHRKYGVKDEYYPLVKTLLLETITEVMGDELTSSVYQSWEKAIDFVVKEMTHKTDKKKKSNKKYIRA